MGGTALQWCKISPFCRTKRHWLCTHCMPVLSPAAEGILVYKVLLLFLEQLTQHPPFTRPTQQLPHVQLFAWAEKQI